MKLLELEPQLLKIDSYEGEGARRWAHVDELAGADGVIFLCPVCYIANGGRVGTHSVICWRPRVPQSINPVPGRWEFEGASLEDLTLVAGSSSVLLMDGCRAHFFVRAGEIVLA